jgi:uncharacterized protein involved in exopolysaccharide biosynthesis
VSGGEGLRARAGEFVRDSRKRRIAYALLAIILALLCVVPRPYVARAKVLPQDASSIGLGSMMNALGAQLQGLAALFGGAKQPVDLYLAIARGTEVTDDVIARLKLVGPDGYASVERARLALEKRVDIHSLTGGIIEVEVRTHDSREAEAMTRSYVKAIGDRIMALNRDRVERKRKVVLDRFADASARVVTTEAALSAFRRRNQLAAPEAELGAALSVRTGLDAQLQAKQVELQMLQQFRGPDSVELQAVQSEITSLRSQIARAGEPGRGATGPNVAGMSAISGEYLDLFRDYRFAQALYDVYARSSEEVAVESLAGEIASQLQVIEGPHLDPDRKYNIPAVALLLLVLLVAAFTELYAPATGIDLRLDKRRDAES